jgi:hypothetical protein
MDFAASIKALGHLAGVRVTVDLVSSDGVEVATIAGTLLQRVFARADHSRLLFAFQEHPFPEGFYLDRSRFRAAEWFETEAGGELRVFLNDGFTILVEADPIDP